MIVAKCEKFYPGQNAKHRDTTEDVELCYIVRDTVIKEIIA